MPGRLSKLFEIKALADNVIFVASFVRLDAKDALIMESLKSWWLCNIWQQSLRRKPSGIWFQKSTRDSSSFNFMPLCHSDSTHLFATYITFVTTSIPNHCRHTCDFQADGVSKLFRSGVHASVWHNLPLKHLNSGWTFLKSSISRDLHKTAEK